MTSRPEPTRIVDTSAIRTAGQSPDLRRRGNWRPNQRSEAYLFLLPSMLGFLIFIVLPVLGSLALSFSHWNLLTPPEFAGLSNYSELLQDPIFSQSFVNTLFFIVTLVPLQLCLGLAIALALSSVAHGAKFYRPIYFMPVVSSVVA